MIFCIFFLVDHTGVAIGWWTLLPASLVVVQWISQTLLLSPDTSHSWVVRVARGWMFVWLPLSTDQARSVTFYLWHYLAYFLILTTLVVLLSLELNHFKILSSSHHAAVYLTLLSFSSLFVVLSAVFNLIYYFVFKPNISINTWIFKLSYFLCYNTGMQNLTTMLQFNLGRAWWLAYNIINTI